MKKITLLAAVALLSMGAFAQNNKGKHKDNKEKKERHEDRKDNRGNDDLNDKDDRTDRNVNIFGSPGDRNDDGRYEKRNDRKNGKYSKNLPAKVRDAFNRDFPAATNVSWTKNRGIWTAHFSRIIGSNTVSYYANGQRVNNNGTVTGTRKSGGIFGRH